MGRISNERTQKTLDQQKIMSKVDYENIKAIAGIVRWPRSFIFKTPDDYGLKGFLDKYTN
jgi:hypothetical protein